ncbi:MAG: PorP/SprF family type IX secretion system membrane protein [Bacteroidia bacterium]|nr:PorP/SprF family type IX secretion system membrane protein [Bacteroidia bacterium]
MFKPCKPILFFCLVLFAAAGFAQDIHFSQFNGSLLNLSPGYTGLFNGDYRVGAIYRSQWSSVPVSYSTFSMHGEMRLKPPSMKKDMLGLGILFNNDKAGAASYGTTQFYVNPSYIYLARPDSSLIMTLGANVGFCSVGFDYSKMTFDSQFNGITFDKTLSTGEGFGFTRKNFVDFNTGAVIQYVHKHKHRYTYAIGVNHISRPVITYQGNDLSRLDLKIINCLAYTTPLNYKTDFVAEGLFTKQGKNSELIPYLALKYYINKDENQSILGGVCLRARDAAIIRFGYNRGTLQSGIAYDVNISNFTPATNRRGAFELFINYVFKSKPALVPKRRACPVFM